MLSLTDGKYLSAKRPLLPPTSNPPGCKMVATSEPPQPVNCGICFTPFLYTPWKGMLSAVRSTLVGSWNTLGKPMKVYPNTNSLVRLGENTCVKLADTDCDMFFPSTGVGYGI